MADFRPLFLFATLAASGCAGEKGATREEVDEGEDLGAERFDDMGGRGEAMPSVRYEETAEANWQKGEEAFAAEDYLAAQRYYSYIRRKFPYSTHAANAELRLGECQFERQRFLEAIDTFQNFVRMHPSHDKVPFALYKSALAYYEQIPSDWFLLPPSHEKDQAAVRDAERALQTYLDRYPSDATADRARDVLKDVRTRLMAHERYVADFYARLEKDRAYVGRLEIIRKQYADVGLTDELLLEIATVYERLGEKDKAKLAVEELGEKFPGSRILAKARALVGG